MIPRCRWSSIAGETAKRSVKRSVKRISDTYALEVSCFRFSLHGFTVVTFSTLSLSSNNILDPVRCVRLQTRFDPQPAPGAPERRPRSRFCGSSRLGSGPLQARPVGCRCGARSADPVRSTDQFPRSQSSSIVARPGTVGRAPPRAVRATLCEPDCPGPAHTPLRSYVGYTYAAQR